jgi:hypothetical protein
MHIANGPERLVQPDTYTANNSCRLGLDASDAQVAFRYVKVCVCGITRKVPTCVHRMFVQKAEFETLCSRMNPTGLYYGCAEANEHMYQSSMGQRKWRWRVLVRSMRRSRESNLSHDSVGWDDTVSASSETDP